MVASGVWWRLAASFAVAFEANSFDGAPGHVRLASRPTPVYLGDLRQAARQISPHASAAAQ
ncbi:MAG: hypothetical protein DCC68_04515 [Planctomycetota bacterium]|nr:MAG: hypothetical protein DCC68_04515 [Planctomycetota bacterium]